MRWKFIAWSLMAAIALLLAVLSCDKDTGINFFTLQQDIEFGDQMDSIIRANPADYPILDPVKYADAYRFMNDMKNEILKSDDFVHKDDFNFEVTIIDKDILNAFAVPGGRLYFYTGLMKYLDDEASLAGVLGHEMAHADRRHSTEQMTKSAGVAALLSVLAGKDKSQLEELAAGLAQGLTSLQFSRANEAEADEYAVRYLADTKYHPLALTEFFEKLKDDGKTSETVQFLSTHPSDDSRIQDITNVWKGLGSPVGEYFQSEYQNFKTTMLP